MSTKKLVLAGFIYLLFQMVLVAQNGNPYWTLPDKYAYSNTTYTLPVPGGGLDYLGGQTWDPSNMYCDAGGNILFFVADGSIYNRYGHLISEMNYTLTVGGGTAAKTCDGWSKVCIVPHPDSCQKYYVFTEYDYTGSDDYLTSCGYSGGYYTGGLHRPVYTQIDMSQQTPSYSPELGKNMYAPTPTANVTMKDLYLSTSTAKSNTITACSPYPGDMTYACTRLLAGSYRLLFVNNGMEIITYKIDVNGIHFLYNYALDGLSGNYGGGSVSSLGRILTEMEVYEDSVNNKIKVALVGEDNTINNRSGVNLMFSNFNFTTGAHVSSSNVCLSGECGSPGGGDSVVFVRGLEFSPNGKWVYVLHSKSGTYPCILNAFSFATPATSYSVTPSGITMNDFRYSQIEMGTDTALYLIGQNGTSTPRMAKITSPSAPGNANSNFHDNLFTLSNYGYLGGDNHYLLSLPDQIDHQNYSAPFNANVACCMAYNPYDKFTYNAGTAVSTWTSTATTQVWKPNTTTTTPNNPIALSTNLTSTVTIGEELRIPAGYTVTIQNMTIKFSPQATFVVEGYKTSPAKDPGRLILKKCTLDVDTRCQSRMWPGVRVWGDNTITRSYTADGYIYIDSMSVITNAWVGVELGYNSFDATYDASTVPAPTNTATAGGGLILATNSSFINNQRDIYFSDCPSIGGVSSVFTCTFTTNAYLVGGSGTPPLHHIQFNNYKQKALIYGNVFSCSTSLTATGYVYGCNGIYSLNSNYEVDQTAGNVKNSFSNFNFGIYAYDNGGNTATITADHSNFTNNLVGVNLSYVNNAEIENNAFKLYNKNSFLNPGKSSGLFLDNCTGYYVQDNTFEQNNAGFTATYGIVASNSGAHANGIFRNTFTNLFRGIQPQYINYYNPGGGVKNGVGLLLLCNIFTDNTLTNADIYVPAYNGTNVGASCPTCTISAGIQYAQGAAGAATGANRPTADNQFSSTSGANDFYIDPPGTSTVNPYTITSDYVFYCPSGTGTTTCIGAGYTSVYKPANNSAGSNLTLSTWTLSATPDCSTGGNGHRDAFTPLQAALNEAAVDKQLYDSLKAIYDSGTADDPFAVNLAMSDAFTNRHLALDRAIRILLRNDDDTSEVQAMAIMKEEAYELPARVQVETGLATNDSVMAVQALSIVTSAEGQSNFVKLYTILVQNFGKSPEQIMSDPSIVNQIQAMDNDSTDRATYIKANTLLRTVGLSDFQPYIQEGITNNDSTQMRAAKSPQTLLWDNNSLVSQPNPFKESTKIKATVSNTTDNAYVVITDMLGKEVGRYKLIQGENEINFNSDNKDQQVFFCSLIIDGVKIKTNKMVLIK